MLPASSPAWAKIVDLHGAVIRRSPSSSWPPAPAEAPSTAIPRSKVRLLELGQQVPRTLNGARHQLREEAHEGPEGHHLTRGAQLMPAIHRSEELSVWEGVAGMPTGSTGCPVCGSAPGRKVKACKGLSMKKAVLEVKPAPPGSPRAHRPGRRGAGPSRWPAPSVVPGPGPPRCPGRWGGEAPVPQPVEFTCAPAAAGSGPPFAQQPVQGGTPAGNAGTRWS